jgi:hypothetical protein
MNTPNEIDGELRVLHELEDELLVRKLEMLRNIEISCPYCKRPSKTQEWTFIQDQWYEGPHGCTGGDTWHDTQTECCHIVCPKCTRETYIYNHPDRDVIVKHIKESDFSKRELFGSVRERQKQN